MATYDLSQNLVTLTNLIPDGDMELSSWNGGVYDTTTKKYGSRSQHFTASGTHVQSISMPTLPVVGHKYYGRHYLKTNGNVTASDCRFEWYAGDGAGLNYVFGWNRGNHPDWEMESSILEVAAVNGTSYVCRSFTVNASSDVWADGLMIIDLTAAFGAGNEPTQGWCDTHIPFFVGTTYLPTNLPKTYKTGDILNIPYTGHKISFVLPKRNMKFECWGAQGGDYSSSASGGHGGYSCGIIQLNSKIDGHLYTGGQGSSSGTNGGFNGGGNGLSGGRGGGGASDIRLISDSLYSRVIVAGGGGGAGVSTSSNGKGSGGGVKGEEGYTGGTVQTGTNRSGGGGQETAGGIPWSISTAAFKGTFGQGGSSTSGYTAGGGGAGWYGGAAAYDNDSDSDGRNGGGGSGYVYTTDTASNCPSGWLLNSEYYLNGAETIIGTQSFTSPTGTSETGHSGSGYIRITIMSRKQSGEYNVGDILDFDYTGSVQTKTLPKGKYKLEVWGAQGGYRSSATYGGKGGYSVGTLTLTEKQTTLYIYSGGSGNTGGTAGGFNGGGKRNSYVGGGGASDIRVGQDSLYARVIVAGGGGSDGATNKNGMYGGGTTGGSASQSYGSGGYGGTQTGVSSTSWQTTTVPTSTTTQAGAYAGFGFGGNGIYYASGYGGAGGGGWYGGSGSYPDGSGDDDRGGGGGSGYVYTSSTASNYPSGCLLNSSYYLADAQTIAGNASFTDPSGSSVTGHSGNGFARITVLEVEPQSNFNFRVRVNNDWKETIMGFVKINGEWKEIIQATTKVDGWWTPRPRIPAVNLLGDQSSFSLTGTTSSQEVTKTFSSIPLVKNHVYYFSCEINQNNSSCSVDFYWPIAEPPIFSGYKASSIDTWTRIGGNNIRANWDSGNYSARIDNNNSGTTGVIQYRNLILIDLTATYGSGLEPNSAWCNEHIKYFGNNGTVPEVDPRMYYYTGQIINGSMTVATETKHILNYGNCTTWSEFIASEYNSATYNDYVFTTGTSNEVLAIVDSVNKYVKKDSSSTTNLLTTDNIKNGFVIITFSGVLAD